MEAFLAFVFGTKIGRTLAAAVLIAITLGLSWWGFSDHYYDKGYDACKTERANVQNQANVRQGALNTQSNTTSSNVAKTADAAADALTTQVDKSVNDNKAKTNDIYRQPPKTAPIALGSCVHPVDDRVQSRIEAARSAANGAAGRP